MASAQDKEYLVTFALAYFLKTSPRHKNDSQHFTDWQDIFKDFKVGDVKSKYKSFLEDNFNYSILKERYLDSKSPSTQKGHVVTVYHQIEELYFSDFLAPGKKYRIYTQSSSFTVTVKDECCKRLMKVFDLKGSVEILSPVDFFVVNYEKKDDILKDFKNNILKVNNDTDILINYEKNEDKTYEHMIKKYFKSGDMIGVSHKMPGGKNESASLKLAGNISKLGEYKISHIDPYSVMMIELHHKTPRQVEYLIDQVIDIKYGDWDMRDRVASKTWKLYFNFNFKELHSQFKNVKFGLSPDPSKGNGTYNGHFYGESKSSPIVGGMAPSTLEQFIKQYSGYSQITSFLAKRKMTAFLSVLSTLGLKEIDIKKSTKGRNAIDFLRLKQFQTFPKTKEKLEPYFNEIGRPDLFVEYQKKLIDILKKEGGFVSDVNSIRNVKEVSDHYISIQMCYFWLIGGRNLLHYLKKRIFFTVFGAITKRGFVGITDNKLIQLAEARNTQKAKDIKVSITAAPHLVLS